jgi:hypothetical protein
MINITVGDHPFRWLVNVYIFTIYQTANITRLCSRYWGYSWPAQITYTKQLHQIRTLNNKVLGIKHRMRTQGKAFNAGSIERRLILKMEKLSIQRQKNIAQRSKTEYSKRISIKILLLLRDGKK